MNMNLRVNRSFIEGMKYPRRVFEKNPVYSKMIGYNSVKIAWKNTGGYLQKAVNEYGSKRKEY